MRQVKAAAILLCSAISISCLAQDNLASRSLNLVKSVLPDSFSYSFQQQRFRFGGCKNSEYQLQLSQPWNDKLSFEATLGYAKNKMRLGLHQQKITYRQMRFMPRYQVSDKISWAAGIDYTSAPEYLSADDRFALPASRAWLVNSRISGWHQAHHIELELSARRWQGVDAQSFHINRESENRLMLSYVGEF